MELSSEAVKVATLLLPGFLTAKVRDLFLPRREFVAFDRFMEVVAFSVLSYLAARLGFFVAAREAEPFSDLLMGSSIAGLVLGVAFGVIVGKDWHYQLARRWRLTSRTGRDDVWQDVFSDVRGNWLLVHLRDGRRLLGWAKYYSDFGRVPSLFLKDAAWVEDDGSVDNIDGEGILVTEHGDIQHIEFLGAGRMNEQA